MNYEEGTSVFNNTLCSLDEYSCDMVHLDIQQLKDSLNVFDKGSSVVSLLITYIQSLLDRNSSSQHDQLNDIQTVAGISAEGRPQSKVIAIHIKSAEEEKIIEIDGDTDIKKVKEVVSEKFGDVSVGRLFLFFAGKLLKLLCLVILDHEQKYKVPHFE